MTDQEWKEVEEQWACGTIKLKVDGYDVALQLKRNGMRLFMFVFVNGKLEGSNLNSLDDEIAGVKEPEWTDIATRFYQTKTKSLHPAKRVKELERAFGKRYCKKNAVYSAKFWYKMPYWTTFNSFKRHLIKHNKSIELVKE